ncbi:MAG TPA: Fe-S protein assembly co-chaperone HscB [Candidatus Acidoferrales bacterium]|nr:Fe-S protein assembly co-chaperone HscB [Candidatus Acidoferrales bacterium]
MRPAPAASSVCWHCGAAAAGAHFCPACGKVQPLAPGAGAGYFAFFGLPEKLELDPAELEHHFLELSWKLHPDNFASAGERERSLSLERAAELNDAYRTLADPVARVEYLLASRGVRKEGEAKQQAPPELLEEVFELNESLEELRMARQAGGGGDEREALRRRLRAEGAKFEGKLAEVDAELAAARRDWDAAVDDGAGNPGVLLARMNEILNRRSYIRNLVANVAAELAESA